MLIIARTTGVQTVVMNGNSNTRVMWWCLGRNGKTERSRVVVWKLPVTEQMWHKEAGHSRQRHQKTRNARLPTVERWTGGTIAQPKGSKHWSTKWSVDIRISLLVAKQPQCCSHSTYSDGSSKLRIRRQDEALFDDGPPSLVSDRHAAKKHTQSSS